MGSEAVVERDQTPLLLALSTVVLIPIIAMILQSTGIASDLAATTATATSPTLTSALTLYWIRRKEKRKSRRTRYQEALEGAVGGGVVQRIVAFGLVAGGAASAIQFVLLLLIDRTINSGLSGGWLAVDFPQLAAFLTGFLPLFWFPLTVLVAVPLGCFAYRRVGQPAARRLGLALLVAVLVVVAIRASFNYSLSRSFDGILNSLPAMLSNAVRSIGAVAIGWGIGSQIARATQKAFLIGRLLDDVSEDDRQTIIDLLKPTPPSQQPPQGAASPAQSNPSLS